MTRVYLYEDSGGSLYLHKHDDKIVYSHVELMVPYGARFELDASEIADGVKGDWEVEKIPYSRFEQEAPEPEIHRIAVWEDGKVHIFGHPGADALDYLGKTDELPP